MRASDLTPPQRGGLVQFVEMSRAQAARTLDRRLSVKEFGQKRMLEKLERKGVIEFTHEVTGPRGGVTRYFQPTAEGYRLADYISINRIRTW